MYIRHILGLLAVVVPHFCTEQAACFIEDEDGVSAFDPVMGAHLAIPSDKFDVVAQSSHLKFMFWCFFEKFDGDVRDYHYPAMGMIATQIGTGWDFLVEKVDHNLGYVTMFMLDDRRQSIKVSFKDWFRYFDKRPSPQS